MKEEIAPSWQDFEKILEQIEDLRQKAQEDQNVSELLYRGQAYSRWSLETTLERTVSKPVSLEEYYRLTKQAKPRIETFADKSWKVPTYTQYSKWLKSERYFPFNLDAYPYFIYLRHHRFPSPLLDWTGSPYIAAFFAMDNPASDAEYVSVYVFWEDHGEGKTSQIDKPAIHKYRTKRARHPSLLSSKKPIHYLRSYDW